MKAKNHQNDNKTTLSVPKLCTGISLIVIGILFIIIWPTFYEFLLYKVSFVLQYVLKT